MMCHSPGTLNALAPASPAAVPVAAAPLVPAAGVMAMVAVQLLVGGLRFCIPESYRSSWRMMHSMWGWATVAAGVLSSACCP
jgi:hypothetical protein